MKKILVTLMCLLLGSGAFAEEVTIVDGLNMATFWQKKGLEVEKVLSVSNKIMMTNKIPKRVPVMVEKSRFTLSSVETVNAYSDLYGKTVTVLSGTFNYIDNDDELAYLLSHEIAHSVEAYGGLVKYAAMSWNSKKYEKKADLIAIDYMVKAGYNPVAAITLGNKIFSEPMWDWGFTSTHPKGSKRLLSMYKYIYVKYPNYLNTSMIKTPAYKNFEYAMANDIQEFHQKQQKKELKQNRDL